MWEVKIANKPIKSNYLSLSFTCRAIFFLDVEVICYCFKMLLLSFPSIQLAIHFSLALYVNPEQVGRKPRFHLPFSVSIWIYLLKTDGQGPAVDVFPKSVVFNDFSQHQEVMEEARQLWKNVEHLLLVQKHWQINLESWDLALFKYNFRSAVKRPASSLIYNYFRSHILLSLTKPAATSTFIWPQTQLAFDQLHFSFKQGHQNFNFHKNSQSKELSD